MYVFMLNFGFVFFLKKEKKRNKYSFRFYKIGTSGQCFSQILPAWHAIEMVETCSFSYAPLKFCTMTPNFDPVFSQYSINCSCSDVGFSKLAPVPYTVGFIKQFHSGFKSWVVAYSKFYLGFKAKISIFLTFMISNIFFCPCKVEKITLKIAMKNSKKP